MKKSKISCLSSSDFFVKKKVYNKYFRLLFKRDLIVIIRNIFIIKQSVLLLNLNFGECSSIRSDEDLIASFLSAFNILSNDIFGSSIQHINYENYNFHFYKDQDFTNTFFIIFADSIEEQDVINNKIREIASLFKEKYFELIKNFKGNTSHFSDFESILIEKNIAQNNCGKHVSCKGCPDNNQPSEIFNIFKEKRERFLAFSQNLLKKN